MHPGVFPSPQQVTGKPKPSSSILERNKFLPPGICCRLSVTQLNARLLPAICTTTHHSRPLFKVPAALRQNGVFCQQAEAFSIHTHKDAQLELLGPHQFLSLEPNRAHPYNGPSCEFCGSMWEILSLGWKAKVGSQCPLGGRFHNCLPPAKV